jgi:class 3 adenylate cyclase
MITSVEQIEAKSPERGTTQSGVAGRLVPSGREAQQPVVRSKPFPVTSIPRVVSFANDPGSTRVAAAARASVRAAQRRFVTVLFTDMVDSTSRVSDLGDQAWLELQESHEAMATQAVRRFRGRVVQMLGDGMLATFSSAAAGVMCAARIVETSHSLGIGLRAGVHAGECEQRGRRLSGVVFHVGARIAGLAGANQVLASQTVTDLVTGAGLDFAAHGRHSLKGLPGDWPLWELRPRECHLT